MARRPPDSQPAARDLASRSADEAVELGPHGTLRKPPTQARALRTVETLFEATARILETEGEAGLNTNRVAERAGYSVGTLYQYFPDKQSLLVAMVRRERERVLRDQQQLLAEMATGRLAPDEALRRYLLRLVQAFGRGRRAQRVLMRLGWPLDAPALLTRTMDESGERLAAALQALADPALPPPDALTRWVLTRAVMGTLRAALLEDVAWLDEPALVDRLQQLVQSLLQTPQGRRQDPQ